MPTSSLLRWLAIAFAIFITLSCQSQSHATQTQPTLDNLNLTIYHPLANKIHHWRTQHSLSQEKNLSFSVHVLVAGIFCFIAAAISSAGGIGGGGLFIPILTIVAGLDLKTASAFSAFMVTGGSIANVIYNTRRKFGGKYLVDYDIALLSEPCMLLGVSVGVICNLVFPEWLITILFAVFLAWSTLKTCRNGFCHWKMESDILNRNGYRNLENGEQRNGTCGVSGGVKSSQVPLLVKKGEEEEEEEESRFPWMKLGVLVTFWFSFFILYLLRGNSYGKGIIRMKPCGVGYWTVSLLQIPLAIAFTAWILYRKEVLQTRQQQCLEDLSGDQGSSRGFTFPLMALLAGMLGGVFGIGGGMLISPLLLQVGVPPEVTAATCSFMVFFSSTMSAFQYILLGMEHTGTALIFSIICFVASLLGLLVVQKAIQEFGRASLIIFSVGMVMALSTVLMTSFGALDVWENYISGNYMWFKLPC